jgi:MFS family permease
VRAFFLRPRNPAYRYYVNHFTGFPFSFGVFQSYYTTHPPFSEHPNGIAAIGTCSSGVMYLWAPVTIYILESRPSIRRLSSIFGLVIVVSAMIASSFSTQVWHLILTQGVLYAIGGSFLYSPTMFYLDEWFVKKKGLAFGIMWAGVGTVCLHFSKFTYHRNC